MKGLLLLLSLCPGYVMRAQKVFTEKDLVAVVKNYHPIAKQALLDVRIAAANVTASRGAFDPSLNADRARKDFDGLTYYNTQVHELKIPTWYGIDFYAGTETINGDRINPEATKGSIRYLGLSVPLVQNLVIDKRRAAVQQAKILRQQSEIVRRAELNNLVGEAMQAYWDWWEQYRLLQVAKISVQNARARLAMVRTAFLLGDRPAIDTLEAATQVQVFEQQEVEASLLNQKARLMLSLYLWKEGDVAYVLPEDAVPEDPVQQQQLVLDSLLSNAGLQPLVQEYDYKLKALHIEKRLKFQALLPEVRVKYNSMARDFSNTLHDAFLRNDYRFGLAFSLPLRLSEGRGTYRAAQLKIEQTRLSQLAKLVEVRNKVEQIYLEWQQTQVQYQQQQYLVQNYRALQRGEEIRFANGESSLFLVNSREAKTIEGQRKELELAGKIQKANVRLRQAAGLYSEI